MLYSSRMLTFNPSLFFQYQICPHWVWRDRYGDQRRKGELPELAQKLLEQGVLHEEDYVKGLDFTAVELPFGEAAYQTTVDLMRRGVPLIYQGVIYADIGGVRYQGRPDLLERVPGSSPLGDYYYRPIDIKNSKDIKMAHWLQLTLYGLILEKMQDVFPSAVAIMNSEHTRIDYELTLSHRQKTQDKIEEILKVMAGFKPPLKLVSTCKQSPWFSECVREAEAANDIALIYRLDSRALMALRQLHITTVQQLAELTLGKLPRISYVTHASLERARLQAKSLTEQKLYWLQQPRIPTAPLKIYFDIEGDPLLQVQYLFGFWIVGDTPKDLARFGKIHSPADSTSYYLYCVAERPEDEARVWQALLEWLALLFDRDYLVYHFADYERSRMLSLAERYGGLDVVESLIEHFVDLSKVVQQSVILPLYFYSIKDIAKSKFLNYHWRHPKAGGAQSIFWYEKWLETGDRAVLEDIINYNEDDVVATEYLHRWLMSRHS